jgi:hypothetical protein
LHSFCINIPMQLTWFCKTVYLLGPNYTLLLTATKSLPSFNQKSKCLLSFTKHLTNCYQTNALPSAKWFHQYIRVKTLLSNIRINYLSCSIFFLRTSYSWQYILSYFFYQRVYTHFIQNFPKIINFSSFMLLI